VVDKGLKQTMRSVAADSQNSIQLTRLGVSQIYRRYGYITVTADGYPLKLD